MKMKMLRKKQYFQQYENILPNLYSSYLGSLK